MVFLFAVGDGAERNARQNEERSRSVSSEVVPEVEIVSLLQEHIPKYKLRADYLTQYTGYSNLDFSTSTCEGLTIQTPTITAEQELKVRGGLTPDEAEAALDYFVLCGDRLSQMTRTYNDVEAVTRLLQVI